MKISDAMKVAGYCTSDRMRGTIYQRVRRTAQSLLARGVIDATTTVPAAIDVTGNYESVSSQSTNTCMNTGESTNTFATPPSTKHSNDNTKRK